MKKKILIFGHNYIGDALMSTPFIAHLKNKSTNYITVLTSGSGKLIYERQNSIDCIIDYEEKHLYKKLFKEKFNTSFILKDTLGKALYSFLLFIPNRIGFNSECSKMLLTKCINSQQTHGSIKYFELINTKKELNTIKYHLHINQKEKKEAKHLINNTNKKNIIIATGTTREEKNWPIEHFIKTIKILNIKKKYNIILIGDKNDIKRNQIIEKETKIKNITGKTSIPILTELIKLSDLLLTGDSGPMHLGCISNKTKIVALFGQTDPTLTGPINDKHIILKPDLNCSPCFSKKCGKNAECMTRIEPETVIHSINKLLKNK